MNRLNEPTVGGVDVDDSSIETVWTEQPCVGGARNENSREHLAHAGHMEAVADTGRLPAVGARYAGGSSVIKSGTRNDKVYDCASGTIL